MQEPADALRQKRWLGANLGLLGSLLAHGLVLATLSWAGSMPAVDFELQLPGKVELGLSEPTPPTPASASPSLPGAASESQAASTDSVKPKPAKPKSKPHPPADAGIAANELQKDAGQAGELGRDAGRPLLAAFAPKGAQLALRLHLGRVRDSELADDARVLLDAIPDWRLIVQGSDLDPIRDLERLYVASPDLQRSSVVIAGQYVGDDDLPRRAVEKLAAARGVHASWRKVGAIAVAPWANADSTERVVALIAARQFAITRPDDLPRVLAIARALAQRRADQGAPTVDPGEALLGLEQTEMLAFSVEGARLFAQGNIEGVPLRFQLSVSKHEDRGLDVAMEGEFENDSSADNARHYWEQTRDRFASHPLLAFIGMRDPLANAQLEAHGKTLQLHTSINVQQARVLLGFLGNALQPTADDARGSGHRPVPPTKPTAPTP